MESIFCLLLVVEAFSLQKVVKILEEVVVGWRQANMADEAKVHSPICSIFKALVMQPCVVRQVRHCHGAELDLSY